MSYEVLNCELENDNSKIFAFEAYKNAKNGFLDFFECNIKNDKIENCINDIKKYHECEQYDLTEEYKYIILESHDFNVYFKSDILGNILVDIYAKNLKICYDLFNICEKYRNVNDDKKINIFKYYFYNNDTAYKYNVYEENENIKDYYPYLNTKVLFDSFIKSKENILIIKGKSGIGKSKFAALFIKYLWQNYDACIKQNELLSNIAYVSSSNVLITESFWESIIDEDIGLVILDDLDILMTSRDEDIQSNEDVKKNTFLNKFLTFTDGLENSKTKFIITTNQNYNNFDDSLIRKGRLFDILNFRDLSNAEALDIWKNENLDPNKFPFKGRVTQCELDSEMYIIKNNINRNYILDGTNSTNITHKNGKKGLGL